MSEKVINSPIPSGVVFNALDMGEKATDIKFHEVAQTDGKTKSFPERYLMPYQYISNQYSTPDCTAHAQAGSVNENNGLEASKIGAVPSVSLIDPVWLGEFGHKIGKITSDGGYINWAFPYLIDWKYISGYTVVGRSIDDLKSAITRNGALTTGSNTITWNEFLPGWVAKYRPNSPGHAFRVDGWDDIKGAFRVSNSWGQSWGDFGSFWVNYNDIGLLYTLYVFHDVDDTSALLRAKAKSLGIWNGTDPDRIATRKEAIIIGFRISGVFLSDYDILTQAKIRKIYDGTRDNDLITLFEAKTIWTRLGITKTPLGVTRGQLVETI